MNNPNDLISIVSFIASIASLVLSVVAIWITFHIKGEADKVTQKTIDVLVNIESDAKTISQVAMPELKAYGDSMRRFILGSGKSYAASPDLSSDEINKKFEMIEKHLTSLEAENDISKIKSSIRKVSKDITDFRVVYKQTKGTSWHKDKF